MIPRRLFDAVLADYDWKIGGHDYFNATATTGEDDATTTGEDDAASPPQMSAGRKRARAGLPVRQSYSRAVKK